MGLVSISSLILMVVSFGLLVRGWITRQTEIMSLHTFFVLGLVYFYFLTLSFMPWLGNTGFNYEPQGWGWIVMAVLLPLFLMVFGFLYRIAGRWSWPDRVVPQLVLPVTAIGLLTNIAVMSLAVIVTFMLPSSGGAYTELLVLNIRPGTGAFLTGLATVLLVSNARNPFYWGVFVTVLGGSLVVSTVTGSDRRFPLSVLLSVPWVAYYFWLRNKTPMRSLSIMAVAAFLALSFVILYSSVRHQFAPQAATLEVRSQQLADLADQSSTMFSSQSLNRVLWQDTALNSCFIIENYGNVYPHVPFNGLLQFLTVPIPRSLWEGKPSGIGPEIQKYMGAPSNLAPGIIGHGWAEFGWFGFIYYAGFFAIVLGIFDRLLKLRAHNPYFVVAVGSSLGNVFGLPRGETFAFLAQCFMMFVVASGTYWVCKLLFGTVMAGGQPLTFPVDADQTSMASEGFDEDDDHYDPQLAAAYAHNESGPLPEQRAS